jgi:hypothetical protein
MRRAGLVRRQVPGVQRKRPPSAVAGEADRADPDCEGRPERDAEFGAAFRA